MPVNKEQVQKIIDAAVKGVPLYLQPYKEPKVWGVEGIGEYWYGAEEGEKSSLARVGEVVAPMADVVAGAAEGVLGKDVVENFGGKLPLVKILTPKGRLSVQFHDAKNELWIVTGIDKAMAGKEPWIVLGFSAERIKQYGTGIKARYRQILEKYGRTLNDFIDLLEKKGYKEALNKAGNAVAAAENIRIEDPSIAPAFDSLNFAEFELKRFYNYRPVKVGDVIPIPAGTLHALGPGVEVVEPQIPGPTQSLEDGATYPVRYYFPGFKRAGVKKELDISRVEEISADTVEETSPEVIEEAGAVTVERLPGGFEAKGLEVHRITVDKEKGELAVPSITSFHSLVAINGKASLIIEGNNYNIPKAAPGGEIVIVPASCGDYKIIGEEPGTQIIDTFTPTPKR